MRVRGSGGNIGLGAGGGATAGVTMAGGAAAAATNTAAVGVVCAPGRWRPFVLGAPARTAPLTHSCRSFYKPPPAHQHQLCRVHLAPRQRPARTRTTIQPLSGFARLHQRRFSSTANMSELKWPSARVRKAFFDYMEQRGHTIVPSGSVVPYDDPTLLFTNAGMNQFKPIFLGTINKSDPMYNLKRAADTQKVIRAGGKHNDLDDVGKDSYHHTFFEMLGNWSFGDYFKEEAIEMAWEILTNVYGLDPKRLYATYFEGDKELGLPPDEEAKQLWLNIGMSEEQIVPGDMRDNFWEMGDQGPCGPSSEIHYDKIGGRNAADLVNKDDPMVVEIWNLVFMQFDRQKDRSLRPLPAKHIDTGMGFERVVSALQETDSNYSTDCFTPLFKQIQQVTGVRPYTDKYAKDDADGIDTAYRVIADHIRTLSFAITDGAVPNSDGRGYVVRRILRRGVRYARKYLNAEIGTFFSKVLPALVDHMGEQFPELVKKQQDIKEILDEEEEAFARTLDRGEAQFEKYAAKAAKNGVKKLDGDVVWRLYDTFGFPVDLTQIMAEERGLDIDENEVNAAKEKAREASKAVKASVDTFAKLDVHQIARLEQQKVVRTDDEAKFVKGDSKGKVQLIFDGKDFHSSSKDLPAQSAIGILLDKTNFYAESGGQVADTGRIVIDDVAEFKVMDVQNYGGFVLHSGYIEYGALSSGDEVICEYDELRRSPIRNNHSGTHVLNHSLREVLGEDVNQKGSLVDNEKLRFDFSHKTQVKLEELRRIEDLSNEYIRRCSKIYSQDVDLDLARQIEGVRAVFGETYPNPVRVVSVGMDIDTMLRDPKKQEWRQYSVEFCGGTHVEHTGLIKDLVLVEESGIAKGIRRIIAYTGEAAHQVQREAVEFSKKLDSLDGMAFGPAKDAQAKVISQELSQLVISTLTKDQLNTRFQKIVTSVIADQKKRQKAEAGAALSCVVKHFEEKKDAEYFVGRLPISANAKALTEVFKHFQAKDKTKSVYVFGGGEQEGAVVHGVYVGSGLSSKGVTAEQWASVVSNVVGGRSGGKEPTRQGQGTHPDKIDEAVEEARRWLEEKL